MRFGGSFDGPLFTVSPRGLLLEVVLGEQRK